MKILITGALGHIGSGLIHSICPGQFDEVRLIDNLSTQRYASLFNLPKNINFNFIEGDILTLDLDKLFKGIDVVIHLAAITDATTSFDKKELVMKVNYRGTEKVILACLKNGCKLFYPSTTSVYGMKSPYAESKLKAERLLMYWSKKGLRFVVCRFGTIFGPSIGMRFHTAVNKFIWQAVHGEPITVWKTALNQKRPYLDLHDAIRAINFIIDKDLFNNEIYNVLTANYTVNDILKVIKKRLPVKVSFVTTKIMNQLSYEVSNEEFIKTGFKFRGDLDKQIDKTIKLFRGFDN